MLTKYARLQQPHAGLEHVNRYWDPVSQRVAAKLLPGEYYLTAEPELLVTVLGSACVVCMRDPVLGIGGMSHFMLPQSCSEDVSSDYGQVAIELLAEGLTGIGASRRRLKTWVVGGADLGTTWSDTGRATYDFADRLVAVAGLTLRKSWASTAVPLKVYFIPSEGKFWSKPLYRFSKTVIERERDYLGDLQQYWVPGQAEIA